MKLETPKLAVAMLAVAMLSGCASSGPPEPPSLELPAPPTDLRAVRKGDKVSLTWTVSTQTTDHLSVRSRGPALVCRSADAIMNNCGTPVGKTAVPVIAVNVSSKKKQAAVKVTATFTDTLPVSAAAHPTDQVTYAVEALNGENRGAGLSNQVHVPSLPAAAPPNDFTAEVTAEGVKILWACPQAAALLPGVQYHLRVYRRLEDSQEDSKVGEPDLISCQGPPLIDQTFEWEKTYEYRAAVITIVAQTGKPQIEIEGDDTPAIKVFAHDIFPPGVPVGLQAAYSGAGQPSFIDLVWSPDTEADLAGYNVYRHEAGAQPAKLNSAPVKAPAYRDEGVQAGRKYFYSVTAVDVRGNESAVSEEASEAVP